MPAIHAQLAGWVSVMTQGVPVPVPSDPVPPGEGRAAGGPAVGWSIVYRNANVMPCLFRAWLMVPRRPCRMVLGLMARALLGAVCPGGPYQCSGNNPAAVAGLQPQPDPCRVPGDPAPAVKAGAAGSGSKVWPMPLGRCWHSVPWGMSDRADDAPAGPVPSAGRSSPSSEGRAPAGSGLMVQPIPWDVKPGVFGLSAYTINR